MKVNKIRIIGADRIGARVLEVQTPKITFRTPDRTVTSTESNYKVTAVEKLSPYASFESPVFERIKTKYTPEKLRRLSTNNEEIKKEITALREVAKRHTDQIRIFYPKFSSQVIPNKLLTFKHVRIMVDLQLRAGCYEMITIPDHHDGGNINTFEKNVLDIRDYVENNWNNFEVIPYIDIKHPEDIFRDKLDIAISNGFNVIGLIYGSLNAYYHNYPEIEKLSRDKEVWFHMSDVRRYTPPYFNVSEIHIPQVYGIDTSSLETRTYIPFDENTTMMMETKAYVESIKRYDSHTLGMFTKDEYIRRYGNNLQCSCPICKGKDIDIFYNEYSIDADGNLKPEYMRCCSNLHEAFSSHNEFLKGQRYIIGNEFREYLQGKKQLLKIEKIKEKISQKSLSDFERIS